MTTTFDPIQNSEEIVILVNPYSILGMDSEMETTTCPTEVNSTAELMTQGDPIVKPQHLQYLQQIQKSSKGSKQRVSHRLYTHKCYICLKTMATRHELQLHIQAHPLNKCPMCGKIMTSYKQLKGHVVRKIKKGILPNQPKEKWPPMSQVLAPPKEVPSVTVHWGNDNGNRQVGSLASSTISCQENCCTNMETLHRQQQTMGRNFDEVFLPHYLDVASILDITKMKDNLVITPMSGRQFDNSVSGMDVTSTCQPQLQGTRFPGTVQKCFSTGPTTVTKAPASAYGVGRYQPVFNNLGNPSCSNNYYPLTPYGNELRTGFQNSSNSTLTNTGQSPLSTFSVARTSVLPSPSTMTRIPVTFNNNSGELKYYKDLFSPLSIIKQFGISKRDEILVSTINNLEQHVMKKIICTSISPTNSLN